MAQGKSYKEYTDKLNTEKLRTVLKELPVFCGNYFRGIENNTSSLTRLNYAYDIRLFFLYMCSENGKFDGILPHEITAKHMERIEAVDIEMFLEYVNFYSKDDREYSNHEKGKARKIAAIRSLFKYLFKHGFIAANVAELIDMPKMHSKPIVRLDPDEVANLLDSIENGENLTETQQKYHKYTKTRDLALITLFLGTGIRISELVGLNITDIDFKRNSFLVTRKGGNQSILYFGVEIEKALKEYMTERKLIKSSVGHEDALFLSMQKKRLSNRSVQQLVKKYTQAAVPLKKISPHKLRSTYGTMLYNETGDIYLVADVLGHKDVNTTRKHYAAINEDKRRMAAKTIKLRED